MEEDVWEFVCECLYCSDYQVVGLVARSLRDIIHGTAINEVIHFEILHVEDSEMDEGVGSRDGYVYVLVIPDGASSYVWLRPAHACVARYVAGRLVTWCNVFGTPKTWARDPFLDRLVRKDARQLGVNHRLTVAIHQCIDKRHVATNDAGDRTDGEGHSK